MTDVILEEIPNICSLNEKIRNHEQFKGAHERTWIKEGEM